MWSPSNPPRGIRKRPNGRWLVERVINGKRKPKTVPTWEEAIKLWAADRAGIELPEPPKVEPRAADTWSLQKAFDFAKGMPKREGGFAGLRSAVNHHFLPVVRYFGADYPIDHLRRDTDEERALREGGREIITLPRTLDGLVKALREGRVPGHIAHKDASIDRVLSVLRKTIKLAVKRKRLAVAPEFPASLNDTKYKVRFYSEEEEAGILADPALWFREFMAVSIDTGLRFSEQQALERTDVDFRVGILLVHGHDARGTKNGEFRSVPMTSRVRAIMQRRCADGWESFDYNYTTVYEHFKAMKKRLGLKGDQQFTIHTARHTCASRLVQRGADLLVVKDWLGHKDIETTLRYAHLRPKDLLSVVHLLEPQPEAKAA